jgi:Xaa-Pro aminopeptidase
MLIHGKIAQAVGILREFHTDCWLTFTRETALNGDPTLPFLAPGDLTWHSALIVTAEGKSYAIVGKYDRKAVEDVGAYSEVIDYVEGIKKPLQELLMRIAPKRIAVNYSMDSEVCDGLTHGMFLTLQEILRGIGCEDRLVSAEPIISALRQRKTDDELDAMRRAIKATEEIFAKVAAFIRPGMTEEQIAQFMRDEVRNRGLAFAWDPHTCPAVFTGPDTAAAHYNPTQRKVEPGHILNMDFGVKVDNYCSDLQRTFYVLRPGESKAPAEVQRGFDTIVRSIEAARAAMKPGVQGVEVDAASRKTITDAGYDEYPHGLGHQVGRFAHDGTALLGPAWEKYAKKPFLPLEERMVFTLEPRLTVPGYGVATIENMVVVSRTGADYLSTPQTELLLVK